LDVLGKAAKIFDEMQEVDAAPTPQEQAAAAKLQADAQTVEKTWQTIPPDLASLNALLTAAGSEPIQMP
jgi:hypothetical protein